jgi:hypothetical protein
LSAFRNAFYAVTITTAFIFAAWLRFSSEGLELFYTFALQAETSNWHTGKDELLIYPIIGCLTGAALAVTALWVARRRYGKRGALPLGAYWACTMAFVAAVTAATAYGHYFG